MKKMFVILGCFVILFTACGKDENNNEEQAKAKDIQIENVQKTGKNVDITSASVTDRFFYKFETYTPAQKYYFCAAFAMGAMSVAKPVTASAMVNYFMGLGVAKYNEGINEETYKAFNAGKNTFRNENLVNTILNRKICENIMNEAADFARERNYHVADLDKRGKREVEKVVKFIKQKKK
ncbi:MAG: hypothetical protein IJ532_06100 [Alphaproteobacteria bacterium]|nr:hypothetical protein [Alphaproteobacteria bacterium]